MLQVFGSGAANRFHNVGGHAHRQLAAANHHHLSYSSRQRQYQLELGTLAKSGGGFNSAANSVNFRAHHVHANATPRQLSDLRSRSKTGHKNQVSRLLVVQLLVGRDQAGADGFFADAGQVKASTIVAELNRNVIAFLAQFNRDQARRIFASRTAHCRAFNAVGDAVSQQVLERGGHTIQHAAVHLDSRAEQIEFDLFAGFFGCKAHHAVQAIRNTFKLHHAGFEQVALQFTCLACLGDQIVFCRFNCALQRALYGRYVIYRLGHHAGQLLHAGKAIELERVKTGL